MNSPNAISAEAATQRRLWGSDPEGWALLSEPHITPLFEAILDATLVADSTELLDVGCGSGLLLDLAARRGAIVHGLDVTPGLLDIARRRLPAADLVVADMQFLPFADASFDVVTAVNAFAFAADPAAAIAEAARVCRPGGRLGVGMFAAPELSESTVVHEAMSRLSPAERDSEHQPYALSKPGNLEDALARADPLVTATGEVPCIWAYRSTADAIRALAGSAGGTRAVEDAGIDALRGVLTQALSPFTNAQGAVSMRNLFRWVVAEKPAA